MNGFYTVESSKPIDCLGGIQGPLTTPVRLSFRDALQLVSKGLVVYKHNPYDLTEKVRVTRSNINTIKFERTREQATSQRLLNRSIQELDTPLVVDVVKKETTVIEPVAEVENISVVTKNNKKETKKEQKVSKPDSFTK